MDQEERGQSEQQPGPRAGRQQQHVVQDRDAAAVADVLQVGHEVRRVREEEPQRRERGSTRTSAGLARRKQEREDERDPARKGSRRASGARRARVERSAQRRASPARTARAA